MIKGHGLPTISPNAAWVACDKAPLPKATRKRAWQAFKKAHQDRLIDPQGSILIYGCIHFYTLLYFDF
jgi:hypothetical protein